MGEEEVVGDVEELELEELEVLAPKEVRWWWRKWCRRSWSWSWRKSRRWRCQT